MTITLTEDVVPIFSKGFLFEEHVAPPGLKTARGGEGIHTKPRKNSHQEKRGLNPGRIVSQPLDSQGKRVPRAGRRPLWALKPAQFKSESSQTKSGSSPEHVGSFTQSHLRPHWQWKLA